MKSKDIYSGHHYQIKHGRSPKARREGCLSRVCVFGYDWLHPAFGDIVFHVRLLNDDGSELPRLECAWIGPEQFVKEVKKPAEPRPRPIRSKS